MVFTPSIKLKYIACLQPSTCLSKDKELFVLPSGLNKLRQRAAVTGTEIFPYRSHLGGGWGRWLEKYCAIFNLTTS